VPRLPNANRARLPPPEDGCTLGLAPHPKLARLEQEPKVGLGILSPQQPDPVPLFCRDEFLPLVITVISTADHINKRTRRGGEGGLFIQ
jgi:hypothetical protein